MAAIYDALGNVIGDDGQPSIDQMQYELARNGKPSPLDTAVNAIKNVAINNNPLMLRKQGIDLAGDVPRVVASGVAPYIAGITQPVVGAYQYASKMPGVLYRENVLGDPQSMQEAATIREGLPQFAPPGARYNPAPMNQRIEAIGQAVAPQTPQGQAVLESATQVFEPLKLPMIGPGSGLPGTSRISPRPLLTPDDVRVLGAEATRVGKQVVDIPTDFANAQSGFQRIDPVTGQPVMGARIQSGVDRLGDIMEQRKMQGLTPIPGLPAVFQPETSMYAVRKSGSKLTTPTLPETAKEYVPDVDPVGQMLREINIDPNVSKPTSTMLDDIVNEQIKKSDSSNTAMSAFRYFQEDKALEMFPDAPSGSDALMALKVSLYDDNARTAKINELYDQFIQTPEGQEYLPNAAPTSELAERHEAAVEGLKNMWGKYLIKNLGTEGNPLVKMAAQEGLTYLPDEDIIERARSEKSTARSFRRNAGMPIEGSFATDIAALQQEIETLNLPIKNAANAAQSLLEQRNVAKTFAEQDPAMIANFKELDALHKEAKKNASNLTRQRAEIQKKLDKLTLADAYETIEDSAVAPIDASTMLSSKLPYAVQQFYPELKESAKRGEMAYMAYPSPMKETGIIDAAKQFYDDVLANRIPKEKAPTYPVDRYIHGIAKERVQNIQKYRTDVFNDIKSTASAIPENKQFSGNVGVIELTQDTPEFVANKEAALSTEALDICIGEGGGGAGTRNFFSKKKDPRWTPIVDILTGKPNPNASSHTTSYVQDIYRGGELPMFRDLETGMPIAALQFMKSSSVGDNGQSKFNIGYASGAQNGFIEPKYIDGIRDYLNTRADDIAGIGENLEKNAGIYDTRNKSSLNKSRSSAQVSADQMKTVDWDSMPRFMTAKDIKQAVQGAVTQQLSFNSADVAELKATLVDNIEFVVNEAMRNSNVYNSDAIERRLETTFAEMQSRFFPTFFDSPVTSMNEALDFLRAQIRRNTSHGSEQALEIATALESYASELETARDDMISQQQRSQQPASQALAPQAQMQQAEQLLQQIERPLRSANDGIVNDALQEYARSLQRYASNQLQNGMDPITVANGMRDTINTLRNIVLTQPTDPTRNFMTDQLGEYVSALRLAIDGIGQWIEGQQQQASMQPQAANLPAEVQQNIDNRNRQITSAYQRPLEPDSAFSNTNDALSEFIDLLDGMATNLYGNGLSFAEIAEHLQGRIRSEIMVLSDPNRVANRGLNGAEARVLRDRLNSAYGNLATVHDQLMTQPEPTVQAQQAPAQQLTRQQQAARDRAPTIANMIIENEGLETPEDIFAIARRIGGQFTSLGRNQTGNTRRAAVAGILNVGDSIGDFVVRPSDLQSMTLREVGRILFDRANVLEQQNRSNQRTRELINDSIQSAFTPNTGSQAVDAYLSQYRDTLTEQLASPGYEVLSPTDVITRLREEIQGHHDLLVHLAHQPDGEQTTGLTHNENIMARNRLTSVLRGLEFNVTPPNQGIGDFEPDNMHGANEPYTMQSAIDMARDLFEQERTDANNFDIPSIEQSIYALREGLFDDERIRRLSPRQQASFSEDVAFRLQNMLDDIRGRRPDRNLVAEPGRASEALDNALANIENDYGGAVAADALRVRQDISEHVNPGDELSEYVYQLRRNRPGMSEDLRQALDHLAEELESVGLEAPRQRQVQPVLPAPATAPYAPIPAIIHGMSDQAITADMTPEEINRVQSMFESITDVNSPEELQNIVSLARSYAMGGWDDFSDVQREWLARNIEEYIGDNPPPNTPPPEEPPQRRGPFRPGGASAVRGVPLGNLNIQPSITAEAFKGPDRQPVSNFLQQVKSMPGVTQEGLKTGLMAFENMDPSRQMTKAEFARELLPSSYDIVDLANSANRNEHDLEYLDDHLDDDDVLDQFKEAHNIPANLRDDITTYTEYDEFSGALQKYLAKKGIRNEEEFNDAIAAVRKEMVDEQYEVYLAENYPGEDVTGDPYQYRTTQRLALDSAGDEYSEFGVTHPDQAERYTHYPQAPEGVIGHVRGTYNPDGLEVKTTDADIFTTKSNSYVIEEIQSDAQKNSQQVAHLHQVHGVLFKASIQKALELGADTVYLPTAKVIASERPSVEGWEARPDDRGLTMQVPIRKDTTSKFKPIYDQAIVKEGLKPLLKIPGVTSKLVSDGDYHEISFTPEAKEHILNGPGQTIPGYKKGGRVHQFPSVEQMKNELMMRRA